jgi:hypothetical protein
MVPMKQFFMTSTPHTNQLPSFADRVTFEQFKALATSWDYSKGFISSSYEENQERLDTADQFKTAFGDHLTALRDQGRLTPIADVDDRGLAWPDAWNRFVDGEPLEFSDTFFEPFTSTIWPHYVSRIPGQKARVFERDYAALVKAVDEGSLDVEYRLYRPCKLTGVKALVKMNSGWEITAHKELPRYLHIQGKATAPIGAVPPPEVVELRVPAPSGKILVADWIHLSEGLFSAMIRVGAPHDPVDSVLGSIAHSRHYAEKFGLLSIPVGEDTPKLRRQGGHFLLDCTSSSADAQQICSAVLKPSFEGHMDTASMIDVQVLTDLLKKQLGDEEGIRTARFYVESNVHRIIDVESGELFMYIPSRPGRIGEFECVNADVSMEGLSTLHAVLATKPLQWRQRETAQADVFVERQRG